MPRFLLFVLAIGFLGSGATVRSQTIRAQSPPAKKKAPKSRPQNEAHQGPLLLSHEEFRKLQGEDQIRYLKTFRELMIDLERAGYSPRRSGESAWTSFADLLDRRPDLLWIFGGLEKAEAREPALVVRHQNGQCPAGYTGDGGFGNCVLISVASRTGTCGEGQRAHSQKNSQGRVMCYPESFYQQWLAANPETPVNTPETVAAGTAEVRGGPAEEETPFHPMTAPPIEQVYGETEAQRKAREAADQRRQEEASRSEERARHQNALICIYAGFPVEGEAKPGVKCEPRSSLVSEADAKGQVVAHTCASADEFKKTEQGKSATQIFAPAKPGRGKTVLCNPMLFGLDVSKTPPEPFCIARGGDATAECDRLATQAEEKNSALFQQERAKAILAFPKFFDHTRWAVERLCSGDQDAEVRKMLEARGRPVESSMADIKKTCGVYRERIAVNGWFQGPKGRGRGRR